MNRFNHTKLKNKLYNIFETHNLCEESNYHVVNSMLETSLRGIDSHGINLFPHYYRALNAKRINANPKIKINKKSESIIIIDADHAFGHYVGSRAIELAQDIAKKSGLGMVSVKKSTHFGAASYFSLQASRNNFLAFSFTNADALVKVPKTNKAYFGTNPICFTAPMEGEDPFCLDMATSTISWNKILNYRMEDKLLEPKWAADKLGNECSDPHKARFLEAIGSYKGFGLGIMVEILCGMLSAGPIGKEILPMFTSEISSQRNISHCFIVINLEKFIKPIDFKSRLKCVADEIRNIASNEKIYIPGDPEKIEYKKRIKNGIPIDSMRYDEFLEIDGDFKYLVY